VLVKKVSTNKISKKVFAKIHLLFTGGQKLNDIRQQETMSSGKLNYGLNVDKSECQ
jgi:hypothetical protein